MKDSIFTKIIKGEIPAYKIYEDDKTLAFLDINPVVEGHTLVIPKVQVEFVWDLEDDDYTALMLTAKKVGQRLRAVMGKQYVGEMIVGTDVPHAHVHIMAFDQTAEMKRTLEGPGTPADAASLAQLAEKLSFS